MSERTVHWDKHGVMQEGPAFVKEVELHHALDIAHRLETSELMARCERLTALLREHEIPLPGEDPRLGASDGEHLAACRAVVTSAYDLLEQLDTFERNLAALRSMVGAGMELVGGPRWRT